MMYKNIPGDRASWSSSTLSMKPYEGVTEWVELTFGECEKLINSTEKCGADATHKSNRKTNKENPIRHIYHWNGWNPMKVVYVSSDSLKYRLKEERKIPLKKIVMMMTRTISVLPIFLSPDWGLCSDRPQQLPDSPQLTVAPFDPLSFDNCG